MELNFIVTCGCGALFDCMIRHTFTKGPAGILEATAGALALLRA